MNKFTSFSIIALYTSLPVGILWALEYEIYFLMALMFLFLGFGFISLSHILDEYLQ